MKSSPSLLHRPRVSRVTTPQNRESAASVRAVRNRNEAIRSNFEGGLTTNDQNILFEMRVLDSQFTLFLAGKMSFNELKNKVISLDKALISNPIVTLKPFINVRLSVLVRRIMKEKSFKELESLNKKINN